MTDSVLSTLAKSQVWDIFTGRDASGGKVNISKVIDQLSSPATISNVQQFLTLDNRSLTPTIRPPVIKSDISLQEKDASRIRQLETMLRLAQSENAQLKKQSDIRSVPREDYDELLSKVNTYIGSGASSDRTKAIFKDVLDNNQLLKNQVDDLVKRSKESADVIAELNTHIENLEKQNVDSSEVERLEAELHQERIQRKRLEENLYLEPETEEPAQPIYRPKPSRQRSSSVKPPIKPIVTGAVVVVLLVGAFLGIRHGMQSSNRAEQVQRTTQKSVNKDEFKKLVDSGEYLKACEAYPDKGEEIEDYVLQDDNLDTKQKLQVAMSMESKANPNDAIKFDIAFFQKDFASVATIYDNSSSKYLKDMIKPRKIMAAYSLMKAGDIDTAKNIASDADDADLSQRIEIYSKFYNANKILNNKIENDHLSKKEKKEAEKQIQKNQEAMDKL